MLCPTHGHFHSTSHVIPTSYTASTSKTAKLIYPLPFRLRSLQPWRPRPPTSAFCESIRSYQKIPHPSLSHILPNATFSNGITSSLVLQRHPMRMASIGHSHISTRLSIRPTGYPHAHTQWSLPTLDTIMSQYKRLSSKIVQPGVGGFNDLDRSTEFHDVRGDDHR